MKFKAGSVTVICKSCGAVTVVDNDALHKMTEYRCPGCDMKMPSYERAKIMLHFNHLVFEKIHRILGDLPAQFNYKIDIFPHYEVSGGIENDEK